MSEGYVTNRHKKLVKNLLKYGTRKEAMIATGYTESYAENGDILHTKGYKKVMKPIVEQLQKEQQRLIREISIKDLDKVEYKDAVSSLDKITKNIQLLTGNATERNQVVFIPSEIAEKNDINTSTEGNS